MSMRPSTFGRFDRQAIYYREPPARRLGVILSIFFLLSLATVAALTSARAGNGEQDGARNPMVALPQSTTH
jgi:hypothetical protein